MFAEHLLAQPDVRDAVAAGFEIGSHGHLRLGLDIIDEDRLEGELVARKRMVEDKTCAEVQSSAFPFGYHGGRVHSAA